MKVREVPCLCEPCITDKGNCLNTAYADPWKKVNLTPLKGDNLRKHAKHKAPVICAVPETDDVTDTINDEDNLDSTKMNDDSDTNSDELPNMNSQHKKLQELKKEQKKKREINKKKKQERRKGENGDSREDVTDSSVTDPKEIARPNITENGLQMQDTVIRGNDNSDRQDVDMPIPDSTEDVDFLQQYNDEIRAEDFFSDKDNDDKEKDEDDQDVDVELLSICADNSKEVKLAGENSMKIIQNKVTTKKGLSWKDIPLDVYWDSILSKMQSCRTYVELDDYVRSLVIDGIPPLEPRKQTFYDPGKHIWDVVAQSEIPDSGPFDVTAVKTNADGNCLP